MGWGGMQAGAQEVPVREGGKVDISSQVQTDGAGQNVYFAKDVIGMPIHDQDGESLGEIKDLAIDPVNGQVLYAILGLGEVAEAQGKLFVVPWGVVQAPPVTVVDNRVFVVNVPRTVLLQAPNFAPAQFHQVRVTEWAPRVNQYYAKHVSQTNVRGRANVNGRNRDDNAADKPDAKSGKRSENDAKQDRKPANPADTPDDATPDKPREKSNADTPAGTAPAAKPDQKDPKDQPPAGKDPKGPAPKDAAPGKPPRVEKGNSDGSPDAEGKAPQTPESNPDKKPKPDKQPK